GAPDAPSGLVITGLSLVLTFFVMAPVAVDMAVAAGQAQPALAPGTAPAPGPGAPPAPVPGQPPDAAAPSGPAPGAPRQLDVLLETLVPAQYQPQVAAADRALGPLRAFLAEHARDTDRETF